MCKLEGCFCDKGVSDVKVTCEGRGGDMVDSGCGDGRDVDGRSIYLLGFCWIWGKGWSLGEGDRLSP
jgi:hypothetical protein